MEWDLKAGECGTRSIDYCGSPWVTCEGDGTRRRALDNRKVKNAALWRE